MHYNIFVSINKCLYNVLTAFARFPRKKKLFYHKRLTHFFFLLPNALDVMNVSPYDLAHFGLEISDMLERSCRCERYGYNAFAFERSMGKRPAGTDALPAW